MINKQIISDFRIQLECIFCLEKITITEQRPMLGFCANKKEEQLVTKSPLKKVAMTDD